ncbi:MAG: hypothetical protein ACP5J0_06250, partial [Pyrobaculum sp.]
MCGESPPGGHARARLGARRTPCPGTPGEQKWGVAEETKLIRRHAFRYVEIEEILAREEEAREMRRREA